MEFYANHSQLKPKISIPFNSYNSNMNYPLTDIYVQDKNYLRNGLNMNQNQFYSISKIPKNDFTNPYNGSNTFYDNSYYNIGNENINTQSNYNNFYQNETNLNIIQNLNNNIYADNNIKNYTNTNTKILGNNFVPAKVVKLGKNSNKLEFAKVTPIHVGYSSNHLPKNNIISAKKELGAYYNSIPQISNATPKFNSYNYKSQNEPQYYLNNGTATFGTIQNINNNINNNTNINMINNIITNEPNIIRQSNTSNLSQDVYQRKVLLNDNYLMQSPPAHKEEFESSYNDLNYPKTPEPYIKQSLFSPIQSPLANYETQSYNGDESFDINEMLKLKEENEIYKTQLKELDKYKAEASEARELKKQIQQLSPLKEKLSELFSLKNQIQELNELKEKIAELEKFRFQFETKADNEEKEEFNSINNRIQYAQKKSESKTIINNKEQNDNDNDTNFAGLNEVQKKESNFELAEENNPEFVKGEIFHSIEELGMIIKNINTDNQQIILNLLYKASADSDKASVFHKKCDKAKSTIVLIETDKGRRFGGYTSVSWKGKCLKKRDRDAFIFSLDNMKIYKNIIGEKAIGCYPKFGPIFLGCQIRIYDNAFKNGGSTFKKGLNFNTDEDFVLTGGDRLFKVKEIEVYEVIAQ